MRFWLFLYFYANFANKRWALRDTAMLINTL